MIEIEFKFKCLSEDVRPYDLPFCAEGDVTIVGADGEDILQCEDILLVEFMIALYKWVIEPSSTEFYYKSMDFEEEPIICFEPVGDEYMKVRSSLCDYSENSISFEFLRRASASYIKILTAYIEHEVGVDILRVLRNDHNINISLKKLP